MLRWLLELTTERRSLNFFKRLQGKNLQHVHDHLGDLKPDVDIHQLISILQTKKWSVKCLHILSHTSWFQLWLWRSEQTFFQDREREAWGNCSFSSCTDTNVNKDTVNKKPNGLSNTVYSQKGTFLWILCALSLKLVE